MDIITRGCAALVLGIMATSIFTAPFRIGEEGDSYTAKHYVILLIQTVPIAIVCGRCLCWW